MVKTAKTLKRYAIIYSIEVIKDKDGTTNDPLAQLADSKPSIQDLLVEIKGFEYQITMAVLSSKQNDNGDREFTYINSTTKN